VAKSPTLLLKGVLCTTNALKEKLGFELLTAALVGFTTMATVPPRLVKIVSSTEPAAKSWWKLSVTLES
jgi:hypothetical protein